MILAERPAPGGMGILFLPYLAILLLGSTF
jgi:hypothetical protein